MNYKISFALNLICKGHTIFALVRSAQNNFTNHHQKLYSNYYFQVGGDTDQVAKKTKSLNHFILVRDEDEMEYCLAKPDMGQMPKSV